MSRNRVLVAVIGFCTALAAIVLIFGSGSPQFMSDATEVDWMLLGELDYLTGKASPQLEAVNGQMVKIPGFMVPLEDNLKSVTEFLLVPSPQACIHVPPPPANQMVLVDVDKDLKAEAVQGPIWVYGELSMKPKRHQYGEASFTLKARVIEPYR